VFASRGGRIFIFFPNSPRLVGISLTDFVCLHSVRRKIIIRGTRECCIFGLSAIRGPTPVIAAHSICIQRARLVFKNPQSSGNSGQASAKAISLRHDRIPNPSPSSLPAPSLLVSQILAAKANPDYCLGAATVSISVLQQRATTTVSREDSNDGPQIALHRCWE